MYDSSNIFAKILRRESNCATVYEDNDVLAFNDINPEAPVHVLVIPKGQYVSFDDFACSGADVSGFFCKVKKIANQLGLADSGYRIVANHGSDAGQIVPHFHIHILGGAKLGKIA